MDERALIVYFLFAFGFACSWGYNESVKVGDNRLYRILMFFSRFVFSFIMFPVLIGLEVGDYIYKR